jgi:hypothetical protein
VTAQQLTIVFDGSSARVVVAGRPPDGLATDTATLVIEAAAARSTPLEPRS